MNVRAKGRVTLVGAGPGDPELLTIAAVKAIASADVILVDDLVHPAVLEHASASARIVRVGKRGPCCGSGVLDGDDTGRQRPATQQAFIERLMISEARRGLHVVRLKGGDPYVFGRGGEERARLIAAGFTVQVIPGISSGIAGPASLGIPVTHRDYSQGVVFVTGHRRRRAAGDTGGGASGTTTDPHDVDWAALAATGLTLVIYMGVGRCRAIVDALIAGGKAGDTPAAAVQSASTEDQRQVVGTLAGLPDDLVAAGIASPAILVIGDVVRCADAQWLSRAARSSGLEAAG